MHPNTSIENLDDNIVSDEKDGLAIIEMDQR